MRWTCKLPALNTWLATDPWLYPALLHLHRACVAASVALFMARGVDVMVLQT